MAYVVAPPCNGSQPVTPRVMDPKLAEHNQTSVEPDQDLAEPGPYVVESNPHSVEPKPNVVQIWPSPSATPMTTNLVGLWSELGRTHLTLDRAQPKSAEINQSLMDSQPKLVHGQAWSSPSNIGAQRPRTNLRATISTKRGASGTMHNDESLSANCGAGRRLRTKPGRMRRPEERYEGG